MRVTGILFVLRLASAAAAQTPTGLIAGLVTDESGAVVPGATISVTHPESGLRREITTGADGAFSVPALPAGRYEVRAEAKGFRSVLTHATVETGSTTSVPIQLQVGATTEVISVESATAQIAYDSHKIDGVITRRQIEGLPLNGRSFLQLAFLEPGVTVSPGTTAQYNSQFSVSVLGGSSGMAAITVDGGNVRNAIEGNTGQNFSQEVVEEFQISTANFDLSTGITATGAINIVTRSGSNDFHGSGYFFFRDHNMAAYPALQRNALSPDPFFARRQSGFWVGGPIVRDRLFFFTNLEHINQDSVVTVQPNSTFFRDLAQNPGSPYSGKQFSQKFDWRMNASHTLFLRYSHDGNKGFGPNGPATLPSNWLRNVNWADQSIMGLTSALKPTLVNDFRFAYNYWQNRNLFPRPEDCPGCIGLGFPQMSVLGTNVVIGNTSNATQGRDLRRYNFSDHLTVQAGAHRMRFGFDYETAPGTGFWGFAEPAAGVLWSPEILAQFGLLGAFGIPSSIRTNEDLQKLPVLAFVMGIGDPSQPPPYNLDIAKLNRRYHLFWQDTWRVTAKFTLNYGLAWQFESTLVNHDLDKPQYLAPVLGADGIQATDHDYNNFSPSVGFAWNVGSNNKTVVRGGAGIYYDTRLLWQRLQERAVIGPLGNGRVQVGGASIPNPLPGIPGVPLGAPLDFRSQPTGFTLGHLNAILPQIRRQAESIVVVPNPSDLSVRGIEVAKQGVNMIPRSYPASYSEHFNVGVQREVWRDTVITADFVYRHFLKQEIGSLDYNRFFRNRISGVAGSARPVMRECVGAEASNPKAQCSLGEMTVRTPAGRTNYKALLVKLDKRFTRRFQLSASYALAYQSGLNGILNLDNWFSTWGPQNSRHTLNISGLVDLPWGFQVSFISATVTKGPVMPVITGIDLDGDGVDTEPIPGAPFNAFNRGLGKSDLPGLVDQFNTQYAGKRTVRNQAIPRITLPANYEFGDVFSSQDLRLTKTFTFRERYRLSVFGEVFNLFNVANLGGYSMALNNPAAFGQATSRAGQVFGSGGPRAFQVGSRFTF